MLLTCCRSQTRDKCNFNLLYFYTIRISLNSEKINYGKKNKNVYRTIYAFYTRYASDKNLLSVRCFDATGWATERASGLQNAYCNSIQSFSLEDSAKPKTRKHVNAERWHVMWPSVQFGWTPSGERVCSFFIIRDDDRDNDRCEGFWRPVTLTFDLSADNQLAFRLLVPWGTCTLILIFVVFCIWVTSPYGTENDGKTDGQTDGQDALCGL